MLIRNLDSTRGHVNGTRYIIRELSKRVIYAEIAVGPYKGKQLSSQCIMYFYDLEPNLLSMASFQGTQS